MKILTTTTQDGAAASIPELGIRVVAPTLKGAIDGVKGVVISELYDAAEAAKAASKPEEESPESAKKAGSYPSRALGSGGMFPGV